MPTRPHPFENIVLRLHDMRRPALRLFMADDELCADERAFMDMLEDTHREAAEVYARKRAAQYTEWGGDLSTTYGQQLFEPLGVGIVSLEEVRAGRKVVPFSRRDDDAG